MQCRIITQLTGKMPQFFVWSAIQGHIISAKLCGLEKEHLTQRKETFCPAFCHMCIIFFWRHQQSWGQHLIAIIGETSWINRLIYDQCSSLSERIRKCTKTMNPYKDTSWCNTKRFIYIYLPLLKIQYVETFRKTHLCLPFVWYNWCMDAFFALWFSVLQKNKYLRGDHIENLGKIGQNYDF